MQRIPYPDKKHLATQVLSLSISSALLSFTNFSACLQQSLPSLHSSLPPRYFLVSPKTYEDFCLIFFQIERLRFYLAQVQRNDAFLIHAGDCAEAFDACTDQNISAKIGLILSFSLVLIWGARRPVVRIGRIAGQYAKPRSSPYEQIGDRQVLSFRSVPFRFPSPRSPFTFPRGDIVNGFDPNDRIPDPERLLRCVFSLPCFFFPFILHRAYFYSATTLNYIRTLLASGFASLHHPRDWSLAHVRSPSLR